MASMLLPVIYLAFISLGLPDSLLGSAWPVMNREFGVLVSWAGIISMLIAFGTIISSLQSDRMTRRFGTGRITAASVALTALTLFGFSLAHSFWILVILAIPYGLGAGSVDASLNNYVALHYESRHMSWLHCMWGIGASLGPSIMGFALSGGLGWNAGYRIIGGLQVLLTAVIVLSLPLWQSRSAGPSEEGSQAATGKPLTLRQIFSISGAKAVMLCFFCYCSLEQTAGLWAASYLAGCRGMDAETAAGFAAMFYIGITGGRAVSGFITMKLNDRQMIRLGLGIIASGVLVLALPLSSVCALAGFVLIGLGCAPVYPCIIHSTPAHFGAERSQAFIGVQMASAYVGTCLMPPLFGALAGLTTISLLPLYLGALLLLMAAMHEILLKKTEH